MARTKAKVKNPSPSEVPVLIVIEGGVADVRYCPRGVRVFVKDYDIEGCGFDEGDPDAEPCDCHRKDPNGDEYHLIDVTHDFIERDKEAEAEAFRLTKEEKRP